MRFIEPEYARNWVSAAKRHSHLPIYWGGEPGAALLGSNLRPEKFTIYTNTELPELAKTYKIVPDPDGEVEILKTVLD